jgi:hypothetical protein
MAVSIIFDTGPDKPFCRYMAQLVQGHFDIAAAEGSFQTLFIVDHQDRDPQAQ